MIHSEPVPAPPRSIAADLTVGHVLAAVVTIALGTMRLKGDASEAFQAVAHLWVGGLIVGAALKRDAFLWGLAISVSLVELYAFLAGGGQH